MRPSCRTLTEVRATPAVEPETFEFQLDRSQLGREVTLYFHFKRPEKRLPTNASPDTTDQWVRLALE